MENKYIIKLLSILPQFIFKNVVLKIYNKKRNIVNTFEQPKEDFEFFYGEDAPLAKRVYDNYFNEALPSNGVAIEFFTPKFDREEYTNFFKEILGWDTFKLNHELDKVSLNQYFINNQLNNIDLLFLDLDILDEEFWNQLPILLVHRAYLAFALYQLKLIQRQSYFLCDIYLFQLL